MRRIYILIISLALLTGAIFIAKGFISKDKRKLKTKTKIVPVAFTEQISNKNLALEISSTGRITAKNKITLYSEVQGVLMSGNKEFKPGVKYYAGETLVQLNSDEFATNIMAQKSNFYKLLLSIMPDIRLDYSESFDTWNNYTKQFDPTAPLAKLPEVKTEQEKNFVASRGVLSSYYSIKNLEIKLAKYQLKAPFTGILTEAKVTPGTLISPGQQIGEFINTQLFELEVAINSNLLSYVSIDDKVIVKNLETDKKWTGKVIRINGKIDNSTQTVNIFIELQGEGLKEGMFLQAKLNTQQVNNSYEIPRNLLVNNNQVYLVKDSSLQLIDVNIVNQNEKTILLKGLPEKAFLLSKPIPKSFNGMKVSPINKSAL